MTRWAALIATLLAASPAGAQCLGFQCPPGVLGAGASGAAVVPPPLDGVPAPTGAFSFRKLLTAYAGSAVRLRRASDNLELDIGFLGFVPGLGAPWNEAAAVAHCAATSCFVRTWYDQSGAARDWFHPTAANQPQLVFNCDGFLPCMQTTTTTHVLNGPSQTPATGLVSIAVVGQRVSGVGSCVFLRQNGNANRLAAGGTANNWLIAPSGMTRAAPDAAWHAAVGVLSPTAGASIFNIDGVETTGTSVPTAAAGQPGLIGAAGVTCWHSEAMYWDNYTLTTSERTALIANMRSFWGVP